MNILFVHNHILRKNGENFLSTGTISSNILKRYLKDDDNLYVYTRQKIYKENEKLVQVNDENIKCVPTNIYKSPLDYYIKKKKLNKEIEDRIKNMDFFILRTPSIMAELTYKKVTKYKKPYIIEVVACTWDSLWNYGNIAGKFLAPIRYFQLKKIVKNAKYVVYVSEQFLQKRYPTNGKWISCSNVNIDNVSEDVLNKRINKIKEDKKNYKIGLIGSLNVKFKGHETAIKAISRIRDVYNIELYFLGSGNKEKWMPLIKKYNMEKNVFFDGTLPAGQPVYEWMDELDLFLIPSLQEGLPRALIEAMSRGCPAIGVKTGGIPELLDEKFVCDRKDDKQISKKIEQIINNKELLIEQATKNFQKAKQYNKDILNEKRREFLDMIMSDKEDEK